MEVVHKLLIDLTASRSMTILYLYGLINVETRFVTYSCSGLLLETTQHVLVQNIQRFMQLLWKKIMTLLTISCGFSVRRCT